MLLADLQSILHTARPDHATPSQSPTSLHRKQAAGVTCHPLHSRLRLRSRCRTPGCLLLFLQLLLLLLHQLLLPLLGQPLALRRRMLHQSLQLQLLPGFELLLLQLLGLLSGLQLLSLTLL